MKSLVQRAGLGFRSRWSRSAALNFELGPAGVESLDRVLGVVEGATARGELGEGAAPHGQVREKGENGRIQQEWTYGNDPKRTRG